MNMFRIIWTSVFYGLILIAHLMWIFHFWWFGKSWKKWLRMIATIFISIIPIMIFWVAVSMLFENGLEVPTICTVCILGVFIVYEIMWIIHLCWWGKSWGKVRKIFITIFISLCPLFLIGMMIKFIMLRI